MLGKNLSHYKVLQKIGQGGMGELYLAEEIGRWIVRLRRSFGHL